MQRALTPVLKSLFLKELARTGSVLDSAALIHRSRRNLYRDYENDPVFKQDWDEALEMANERLEAEAYRRAVLGVEEPVFQGGVLVGKVQRYSDGLLKMLLTAHNPNKFSDKLQMTGANGGPIQHTQVDLSELSDEDLANLEAILTRAATGKGGKGQAAPE